MSASYFGQRSNGGGAKTNLLGTEAIHGLDMIVLGM